MKIKILIQLDFLGSSLPQNELGGGPGGWSWGGGPGGIAGGLGIKISSKFHRQLEKGMDFVPYDENRLPYDANRLPYDVKYTAILRKKAAIRRK